jgi:hypothetical protein
LVVAHVKNTHEAGCSCENEAEHAALVHRVNESYKKDNMRSIMRQGRNSAALRARVVSELSRANGDYFQ